MKALMKHGCCPQNDDSNEGNAALQYHELRTDNALDREIRNFDPQTLVYIERPPVDAVGDKLTHDPVKAVNPNMRY